MTEIIFLIAGLALGIGVMWVVLRNVTRTSERALGEAKATEQNLRKEIEGKVKENLDLVRMSSGLQASNSALNEKLTIQKEETENMGRRFTIEFENIANRILDDKSKKFTEINRENISSILKPLGDNIENFRKKVEETYDKEAKERFSLGKEVEKLVTLNQRISEEANNLTNALKGSSKVQGNWGEMILENILDKSGLVKDREYFIQETLRDDADKSIRSEDGRRMIPDVRVQYPDGRNVIIDSKVSLTAYAEYCSNDDIAVCDKYKAEHLASVKRHVDELSRKSYHEYTATLDFVMMFVPNEPAYMLAMQAEPNLWSYAYNKGVLLMSPTNIIASLRLIQDLWKREYQNRNALDIAERGGLLYDKFVGFAENMERIGESIRRSGETYDEAIGQLRDGRGNLIGQAEKLRELGVKAKKKLSITEADETHELEDGKEERL